MSKIFRILSVICLIAQLLPLACAAEGELSLSATAAVLLEAESGRVIYEKNGRELHSMASTTKIMTAVVALEAAPLDKIITTSEKAVGIEGSSIYLHKNEQLTLEDMLYALLLESANDAAAAIAIDISGGETEFASLMNEKAGQLGLSDTHFTNPHGLDNEQHYTTAYDLAALTCYALKIPKFREIVSTYKHTIPLKNGEGARLLINHNRMLKMYEGAIGVKTGFTKKSGRCLVTAAERNGVTLVAVTLDAPDDWNDHREMLDYGFTAYENVLLSMDGEQAFVMPVVGGESDSVSCRNYGELRVTLPRENQNITRINEMKSFYWAPVKAGDLLGRVVYYNNGSMIGSVDIIAEHDVAAIREKKGLLDFIGGIFNK